MPEMSLRIIRYLLLMLLCSQGTPLFSQVTTSQVWYTYNHQAIVSKHWGYMFDLNHRTEPIGNQESVLSAGRAGITYMITKNKRITAGYAWFGTHFKNSNKNLLQENRLWQQYQVFGQKGKTAYFHRIRVEQRWRELMPVVPDGKGLKAFSARARYMYQHQGPIVPLQPGKSWGLWWQGATEIMLHAGDGIDRHYFDQLRLIGGVVVMPTKSLNLAILYQYINQYRPATDIHVNNHTIRLTLLHQLDFSGGPAQGNNPIKRDE